MIRQENQFGNPMKLAWGCHIKSFNANWQDFWQPYEIGKFWSPWQENQFGNPMKLAWGCRIKSFQRQLARFLAFKKLASFDQARKSIWQPYEVGLRLPHPAADTQVPPLTAVGHHHGFTITCKIIFWQTNITMSSVLLQTPDGYFQLLALRSCYICHQGWKIIFLYTFKAPEMDARNILTKQLILDTWFLFETYHLQLRISWFLS